MNQTLEKALLKVVMRSKITGMTSFISFSLCIGQTSKNLLSIHHFSDVVWKEMIGIAVGVFVSFFYTL